MEELTLTAGHWEVIRYLREHYSRHGTQASVRDMITHFRPSWASNVVAAAISIDSSHAGGPQKQGNRLAGLLRTKGEH